MSSVSFKVATRTDIGANQTVKLGLFDIKAKTEVAGVDLTAVMQPSLPALTRNGPERGAFAFNFDIIAKKKDVLGDDSDMFVYLDNIQTQRSFAPRVSMSKKVGDLTYDVTYARKGNTSYLPRREPIDKSILVLGVHVPVSGHGNLTTKWEFFTLRKEVKVTTYADVNKPIKAKTKLETTYNFDSGTLTQKGNFNRAIGDTGIKADLELKTSETGYSGRVALSKDDFTLDLPFKDVTSVPDLTKAVLKCKYNHDF